jgi:hypothetical protein
MEMQQMMELLLARMDANTRTLQEQMLAEMKAERKGDRELLLAIRQEMNANTKAFKEKTDALVANIKNVRKETTSCHAEMKATKTEPDPGMMQSVEEHQEIPIEDAAVMPVGGLRKRRRDRNLAAGRCQKPKRRIQANCESKRRLNIASRKVSSRATVAWRKIRVFRKIVSQENCGPRSKLTAAGIKMTRHAWRKEKVVRKDCVRDQREQEIQRGRTFGKGCQQESDCSNCERSRRVEEKAHRSKGKKTAESFRGRIARQVVVTPSWLRKIRKLTLWRGRPHPKRKKSHVRGKSRANLGSPATP